MLNFNITPYNDDFSDTKHFYRILFRPSVAVQARELTQTQSILQQQIKNLGDSIYQHGSMVVPGQVATDAKTNYVCLNPTFGTLGNTPIPINLTLFQNQIVVGLTTGLKAQVVYATAAVNTDPNTIFVKYLNTGTDGSTVFASGEQLTLANSTTPIAQVQTNSPTGLSISAQIDEGIYYIWGFFVRVEQQYLLLNKYSNITSCRVGLEISESVITPEEDPSLLDNAQGSPNYAAPGAHRYKIDLTLTSKDINDTTTDNNFVELVRLINSVTQTKIQTDTYSIILKEMANRMADTNGDFAVRNFSIDVRESLDTSFVSYGTATGATVAVTSPATAATISLASSASPTNGAYNNMQIYLNDGSGAGQTFTITGYVGSTKTATLDQDYAAYKVADITTTYTISDPTKINRGIYPPAPPLTDAWSGPYGDPGELAIGMESGRAYVDGYRIDTLVTNYVTIAKARTSAQTFGAYVPTPIGSYIYTKNVFNLPLTDGAVVLPDFLTITFVAQKVNPASRNATLPSLGTARVHSFEFVQGTSPSAANAVFKMYVFDIMMNPGVNINSVRAWHLYSGAHNNIGSALFSSGDVCTVFSAINVNGTGMVAETTGGVAATVYGPAGVGSELLISYDPINNLIITEPNSTNAQQILVDGQFTIVPPTGTVPAPGSALYTSGTLSARTQLQNTSASTLIYPMPQQMVKTIRNGPTLSAGTDTTYNVRMTFDIASASGVFVVTAPTGFTFLPNYNYTDYTATVIADSANPSNLGLNVSAYLVPASGGGFSGTPAFSTLTLQSISNTSPGYTSTIKLMATMVKSDVFEKTKVLTSGTAKFASPTGVMSLGTADIVAIQHVWDSGSSGQEATGGSQDTDILNQYAFDTGQRDYFYDIGSIIKLPTSPGPVGQILIEFTYYVHGAGDYFSVDSYKGQINDDLSNIPTYSASNGRFYALRDCLDFRPRIADNGLSFSETGSSYSLPLQPSQTLTTSFQYYLGRIDKIYLDQYGVFNVITGTPSQNPQPPADPIDGMMLYTIQLNPYTISTSDMTITPTKNPRYTMQDIGKLEQRIANLEYYTSLNQLETQTATMTVTNTATGQDNFKNGFVTDNFTGHTVGNVFDPDYNCAIDPSSNTLRPSFIQLNNTLNFWPSTEPSSPSSAYVERCGMLFLPYTETVSIQQPFATDIINVNPFAVFTYYGDIDLIPATDTWKDTVQRPVINVDDDSALADVLSPAKDVLSAFFNIPINKSLAFHFKAITADLGRPFPNGPACKWSSVQSKS